MKEEELLYKTENATNLVVASSELLYPISTCVEVWNNESQCESISNLIN